MILTELPELRKDKGMMRAYMFLLDFLEAISNETSTRLKSHQHLLRSLLEAAKISEDALNDFFTSKADKVREHCTHYHTAAGPRDSHYFDIYSVLFS